MSESMQTSPVHERHVALGAKLADFGGWSMPIEYPGGGVVREHTAVREHVGIFDVSHLGKVLVRGPGARDLVNRCLTNDLGRIGPGQAQYTMCCTEDGGVVDDMIAYLVSDDEVFLIPNAANTAEVVRMLRTAAPDGVELLDRHTELGIIAVQGRSSAAVLQAIGLPTEHDFMSFVEADWHGRPVTVCRTGYTGEPGYELVPAWEDATALWDALLETAGPLQGLPCGLGARDTLRTEMGFALHGHELSRQISPVMARTGWAVGWDKEEGFWGQERLREQRAAKDGRLSRGLLVTGRGIPRPGCQVLDSGGEPVGEVTSGTFSPTLKQGIALALTDRAVALDDEVSIDVRGRQVAARVVKPPFVDVSVRES